MNRILLVVLLSFCAAVSFAQTKSSPAAKRVAKESSELQLASVNAMVFDIGQGKTLYSKNANAVVPIASVTKLMTAMIVLDAKLPLDELIDVTNEDRDMLKNTYSRVRIGSELSRREMLKLALMSSENRAASALGRHYPGGRSAFVKAMNLKAKQLGMTHTEFLDTTGLSSGNISTASDLVKMVVAANKYNLIRDFTTSTEHVANFKKPRYVLGFHNTNALVKNQKWDIQVSKTGFTNEAGRCLVMLANVGNRQVAFVLLDSYGKRSPMGDASRVRKWMETGVGGSIPSAEARNYERTKNARVKLSTLSQSKSQG